MAVPTMTPQEHWQKDVLPNLRDFFADRSTPYKASNLAIAIAHWVEWTFRYYAYNRPSKIMECNTPEKYCYVLAKDCPALRVIWDFALTKKHRILDIRPESHLFTSSTGSTFETENGITINENIDLGLELVQAANFIEIRFGIPSSFHA